MEMQRAEFKKWSESDEERRKFHSYFFNCFGACDTDGWSSCCLASWCPCVAFGMNVSKATGRNGRGVCCGISMLIPIAAILGCVITIFFLINSLEDDDEYCDGLCPDDYYRVFALVICFLTIPVAVLVLLIIGFAGRRRVRSSLDMHDSAVICLGDMCASFWFPTGLCQETRTMLYNRVENGQWKGPETMENSSGSAV